MIQALGLDGQSKGLDAAIIESDVKGPEADEKLDVGEAKRFRSIAALPNYVALDRPDIQVAVSILRRDMAWPTKQSWVRLKRVGRYLKKHPTLTFEHREPAEAEKDLRLRIILGQRLGRTPRDEAESQRRPRLAWRRS